MKSVAVVLEEMNIISVFGIMRVYSESRYSADMTNEPTHFFKRILSEEYSAFSAFMKELPRYYVKLPKGAGRKILKKKNMKNV